MREPEEKPSAQLVTTPTPATAKVWIEPTLVVLPVEHAESSFGGHGADIFGYS